MDDYTLMTTESMALVLNDNGCCIRHPSIRLKETDSNGDVYLKEACPLCQEEYSASQETLLKKRRELASQIESLEEEPPALTKGELSLEGLAGHMLHIQQMQDILMFQKEKEVLDLRKKVDEQQALLTEKSVEIALLKERMSTQKQEMEKELKSIKRAVAMDRERRRKTGGDETCADIRIDNLIVHGFSEDTSPREIHDIAAKAVQTKIKQHKKDHGRSDSTSTEDTPHATNGNSTGVAMAVAGTAAAVASSPPPSPKKKEEKESLSPRQPNRYESKGEVPATLPESTEKEEVPMDQETSRVKALAQELNRKESLEFVPPNDRGAPATFKPKNRTVEKRAVDIECIPDNVGVGIKVPDDEEEVASLDNEPEMKLPAAGGVAKIPDDMWENDDTVESEKEDAFEMPDDLDYVPGNLPAKKKSSSTSSFKKPGPLTAHLMETKAAAMEHPNERRKDPLEASIGSLKPPGTFQPASHALPTVSDLPPDGGARGRGPIDEFEIDEEAPPKVPLEEQVTLGSAFVTDRFEPRIAGGPGEVEGEDEGTIGQNTAGPTVASSTYGEDRMVVKDQLLLDPYGDKGVYSGQVLLSTGLPHGSGKMIYEDDGRTYDGDWRHGRWHGWGRATFSNGDAFEGFYKYDQRHGHGKYSWKDGRIYEGDFKEDKRHGKGHFIWPDGAEYTGDFRNGQREGRGAYRFSDGGRYEGEWINGRYEGRGRCEWHDGRIYEGEWKAGMAHGVGVETYPDGRIRHSGKWIKDEPIRE